MLADAIQYYQQSILNLSSKVKVMSCSSSAVFSRTTNITQLLSGFFFSLLPVEWQQATYFSNPHTNFGRVAQGAVCHKLGSAIF